VNASVVLRAYLLAWLFALSVSLGAMAALMVFRLTGGSWGAPVRRYFEAALAQVPLLAVLAIPLALGLPHLFEWVDGGSGKRWYLNEPFFLLRAGFYLAAWIALAVLLRRSRGHAGALSAVGLLIYGVTTTFAAVDWIGSLAPQWSSTALGLIVITGQGLAAFAFAVSCAAASSELTADQANDLGNLLLAFVMTWMYLVFMQFLIIWAEDLPRENVWYLTREEGVWPVIAVVLVVTQFVVPFGALLFRRVKRDPRWLLAVALLVLVAHWVDIAWLVLPPLNFHWTDFVATVCVGGGSLYAVRRYLVRVAHG
jgi:hypothetical protein